MTKYVNLNDITNIVKNEMLQFTKTFIPQLEKSVVLYERVDKLETKILSMSEKLEKVKRAVSHLQPVFDTMESSVRYMKEQFDDQAYKNNIQALVDTAMSKESSKLVTETKASVLKEMNKDKKHKDFKMNLKKVEKRLSLLENDLNNYKEDITQHLDTEINDIKGTISKESAKCSANTVKFKEFKSDISGNLKELVKFIGDNYVPLNTYINFAKENEENQAATQEYIETINTTLSDKITALCKVVKESIDGKLKLNIDEETKNSTIESKLDKINNVI